MATVTIGPNGLNVETLSALALLDYNFFTVSPLPPLPATLVRGFDDADNFFEFRGSGIVFNPITLAVTAGTINEMEWVVGGALQFEIVGLSVSAVTFYNLAIANNTQGVLDLVFGGADTINGSNAIDIVGGFAGADIVRGFGANDILDGGAGDDRLIGGLGDDTYLVDAAGDVTLEAINQGVDTVISAVTRSLGNHIENLVLDGATAIDGTGNTLANVITGNNAANKLFGANGADTLVGGGGGDTLDGGGGADTMSGGAGNDTYIVNVLADSVVELGGQGVDTVRSSVTHTLSGDVENLIITSVAAVNGNGNTLGNSITGGSAANVLNGLGGADTIDGGTGGDTINGGTGSDTLTGGGGADIYVFNAALGPANDDVITDFNFANDFIHIDNAVFTGLALGALAASAFHAGTAAAAADDRIIYDAATGALYFDADGVGGAAQKIFATITPGATISAADFVVI